MNVVSAMDIPKSHSTVAESDTVLDTLAMNGVKAKGTPDVSVKSEEHLSSLYARDGSAGEELEGGYYAISSEEATPEKDTQIFPVDSILIEEQSIRSAEVNSCKTSSIRHFRVFYTKDFRDFAICYDWRGVDETNKTAKSSVEDGTDDLDLLNRDTCFKGSYHGLREIQG